MEQARFANAFTFRYSQRPGTPAATMPDQVSREVMQHRYQRLVALQNDISWQENKKQLGREVEVLVALGEGRKDAATERISGRAADNRLVHLALDPSFATPRAGDVVTAVVTHAATHHLIADKTVAVRRTAAGDAGELSVSAPAVTLGMPTLRVGSA